MRIERGAQFSMAWAGRPPGMSSGDFAIWQRWRPFHVDDYTEVYYDASLIPEIKYPLGVDDSMYMMWDQNIAKRIDVLAYAPTHVDIIEIRVSAGFSALAAVEAYESLYRLATNTKLPTRKIIITDSPDAMIIPFAAAKNIDIQIA